MTDNKPIEGEVEYVSLGRGLRAPELVGLGTLMAKQGISTLAAQGLIANLQRTTNQVTMAAAREFLDEVAKVQGAQLDELHNKILTLPSLAGYINRAEVLRLLSMARMPARG